MSNLPKIQDLYNDRGLAKTQDTFITLLNQPPKPEWIKTHPFIRGYKYLPIERIEYLLKTIFKKYKIEVTGQGTAFNGVWVTVRVHYVDPISGEWLYHDGIGASQIQTKKGSSPSDLANINNNAIVMAFPNAKAEAFKNACKGFGKLFGSDLSRSEINYSFDLTLIEMDENHPNWDKVVSAISNKKATIEDLKGKYDLNEESEEYLRSLL